VKLRTAITSTPDKWQCAVLVSDSHILIRILVVPDVTLGLEGVYLVLHGCSEPFQTNSGLVPWPFKDHCCLLQIVHSYFHSILHNQSS